MPRKRKTPDHLRALIQNQAHFMNHTDELIRVKLEVPVENQAEHVRKGTVEQFIARAEGVNLLLERALCDWGCYAGFMYLGKPVRVRDEGSGFTIRHESVGTDHPEFQEWRRCYFTRS